jgi:hypothetical protein
MGGLGRPVAPVVGPPTHPVMQNLVVLWKMSPLRRGVRAGARLWAWARGPARRSWVATGPSQTEARGADGPPGPLRGEARGAQGYLLGLIISRVRAPTGFAAPIEPNCRAASIARVLGTTDRRQVHVVKAAGKRCLSGTGFSNGRIVRVSSAA